MKRGGIINQELSRQLAGLGHTDGFMVCDAGFPIPKEAIRIDLALSFGVPGLKQCLRAILEEIVVEEVVMANEMETCNQEGSSWLGRVFKNQKRQVIPQKELLERAKDVKFFVRTGELAPYSNLILFAASGVGSYKESYIINPGEDFIGGKM